MERGVVVIWVCDGRNGRVELRQDVIFREYFDDERHRLI